MDEVGEWNSSGESVLSVISAERKLFKSEERRRIQGTEEGLGIGLEMKGAMCDGTDWEHDGVAWASLRRWNSC